jgi:nucleoside-diphosphate-sugar epimerase
MVKNILITGGCGFLGQYIVRDILEAFPDSIIKVIDLKKNQMPVIDHLKNPRVKTLLNKDICNYDNIKLDFKDVDTVIHLAGIVSFSIKDKDLLQEVNVEGTKNVLKAINENKVKNSIHISSVAALGYNDKKDSPINETYKFDWKIAKSKKKYYMLTKHLADVEIEKSAKFNALILYPGLMFGPGDVTNSARLIKAIQDRKIPFNMPGGTNIIDVRDISKGIIDSIKNNIQKGHYLLSGYNLEFKQVNATIANQLKVKPPKNTLPRFLNPLMFRLLLLAEVLSKKKLELTADNVDSAFKYRYFSNKKAENNFGWKPEISFKQTITDTIDWMNENGLLTK